MPLKSSNPPPADRADETKKRILRAAVREFSDHGLAGARTDAIARAAKVNKALLYYYFKSKDALYTAALQEVFDRVIESTTSVLELRCSPGEHVLRLALNHFDRLLTQTKFQTLMQQEMVRFRQGKSKTLPTIAKTVFRVLLEKMQEIVEEGVRIGELCPVDAMQVVYSVFGHNVFYFLSAPMMQLALPDVPFTASAIATRRNTSIRFLGRALFVDCSHGAELAERVLATTPVPEMKDLSSRRKIL